VIKIDIFTAGRQRVPRQAAIMDIVPRNLIQQRQRLRRVIEYVGRELGPERSVHVLSLRALANVACWSPEHFDRVYRQYVGEPPMVTLRRLRLQEATHWLAVGLPLREVAHRAGYGSTQAFGRAFVRQHGALPSVWPRQASSAPAAYQLAIVRLAQTVPCHMLSYRGDATGRIRLFDTFIECLQRSRSPRSQWQVFGAAPADAPFEACSDPAGQCEVKAVVLAPPLSAPPCGMDIWSLRAGNYARIPVAQALDPEWNDVLADAGWQRTDAPVLRHYDTDPAYTVAQERREWLYLPVARC
jgi:AraC family transcriptional regulator